MNQKELQNILPQTPEHFVDRMEQTLKEIENMNKKTVRYAVRTPILVAAILLALSCTALAVGAHFGIFDMLNRYAGEPMLPLEGAEEMIQTGFPSFENEYAALEIREAMYVENSVKVLVHVTPKNGATFMYPSFQPEGIALFNGYGISDVYNEDGSADFLITAMLDEAPEKLAADIVLPLYQGNTVLEPAVVHIELQRTQGEKAQLIPQNEGERWRIISAEITRNAFSMTYDILYAYEPILPKEDMGVDLRAFTPEDEKYTFGDTGFYTETAEDGSVLYRQIGELQTAEAFPESIVFKPKVIGGANEYLDTITCKVEAEG